ncbi:hypothetical protein ACOMHN_064810 [Nucella lapillus]
MPLAGGGKNKSTNLAPAVGVMPLAGGGKNKSTNLAPAVGVMPLAGGGAREEEEEKQINQPGPSCGRHAVSRRRGEGGGGGKTNQPTWPQLWASCR